jgi:hypothetical protein
MDEVRQQERKEYKNAYRALLQQKSLIPVSSGDNTPRCSFTSELECVQFWYIRIYIKYIYIK